MDLSGTTSALAGLCPGPTLPPGVSDLTPTQMVASVRAQRSAANTADVEVFQVAVAWAHAHPDLDGDGNVRVADWEAPVAGPYDDGSPDATVETEESFTWFGIPPIAWSAPASFAAANQMSTVAGRAYLRDALVIWHRLPLLAVRVMGGEVPIFRARRVAQSVLGKPRDVCAYVDQTVTPIARTIGFAVLDRVIDEAMLTLYPEEREQDQLDALDACHVTLDEASLNHTGIAEMFIRGDRTDLKAFEITVAAIAIAAALKTRAETTGEIVESLGVRRSQAVGVLADPQAALDLLAQAADDTENTPAKPTRSVELVFHLSEAALHGCDPVGTDHTGRPFLTEVIRAWATRSDTAVTIRPVVDLNDHHTSGGYEITGDLKHATETINRSCVFPWCSKPSTRCDKDHTVPWDHNDPTNGGPSCSCNIAPLCRHHHRLKTHAGWTYTHLDHGRHRWRDPHGGLFITDHTGTQDITPEAPPAPPSPLEPPDDAASSPEDDVPNP